MELAPINSYKMHKSHKIKQNKDCYKILKDWVEAMFQIIILPALGFYHLKKSNSGKCIAPYMVKGKIKLKNFLRFGELFRNLNLF